MGPRPFSRGNLMLLLICALMPWLLQWGRDLSVAETGGGGEVRGVPRSLQWGRDLSVAETTPWHSSWADRALASMGPRPFSRGNRDRPGDF